MSTNLAPPSPDELLLFGEGPANVWQTATNRKKVIVVNYSQGVVKDATFPSSKNRVKPVEMD